MSTIRKHRLARLVAFGVPVALLGALALALALVATLGGGSSPARADVDPAVNLSLSTTGCDSSSGPTKCQVEPNATFTVSFNVLGQPTAGYAGWDLKAGFAGSITYVNDSLVPPPAGGSGTWPGCAFPVGENPPEPTTELSSACANISASNGMYLGVLAKFNVTCGASGSGTITLVSGVGNTDLVDQEFTSRSEAADEALTINCGTPPPVTNTPVPPTLTPTPCDGPCPTATPTNTPVPPTATRTPAPKDCGDVNDDGSINPVDAQLILQFSAGLLSTLQNAPSADVNNSAAIDPIDATLILQESAGLIPASGLHCS